MAGSSSVRAVHRSDASATAGAASSAVLLVSWAAATALWTGAVAALNGPPARIVGALIAASGFAWWLRRDLLSRTGEAVVAGSVLLLFILPVTSTPRVGAWAGGVAYGLAVLLAERLSRVRAPCGTSILTLTGWHLAAGLLLSRSSLAAFGCRTLTDWIAGAAAALTSARIELGADELALGGVATLFLPLILLTLPRLRRSAPKLLVCAGGLTTGVIATAAGASILVLRQRSSASDIMTGTLLFQVLLLVAWTALAFLACKWLMGDTVATGRPRAPGRSALLLACLLPLGVAASGWHGERARGGRVLVYRDRDDDWQVPRAGVYGRQAAGRWGLLYRHFETYGFEAAEVTPGGLSSALPAARAIVFPQPRRRLLADDLTALHRFIANGGGMLYLADHTDVHGCLGPANEVLAPYGIQVNFDSAVPARDGWANDLIFADHPVVAGLRSRHADTALWVGASLELDEHTVPIIVGRRGLSDEGNRGNEARAYLGNYRADPGEAVGDLVLAAAGRHGRGRVVAFGDTSPFQNLAAARSWQLCQQTVTWLAAEPEWAPLPWLRRAGLLVALVGAAFLWLISARGGVVACSVAASLGLVFVGGRALRAPKPPSMEASLVCVLVPELGRASPVGFDEGGILGCLMAIARSGRVPRIVDRITSPHLALSSHWVMFSPGGPLPHRGMRQLEEWVVGGGTVMAACSPEDWRWLRTSPLFAGAEITARALGNGTATDNQGARRHACDAYVLELDQQQWEPLLTRLGESFAAQARRGNGHVVLIADPAFLTNRGLEGAGHTRITNSEWLTSLIASGPPARLTARTDGEPCPIH